VGIEPADNGFADRRLSTWLYGHYLILFPGILVFKDARVGEKR
jgi:hypothetical protein